MVIPAPEGPISDKAKDALTDMIESQLYLLAQPHLKAWPMASRMTKTASNSRESNRHSVESSAAKELVDLGLVEQSSRVTYVVSKSGLAFYNREIRTHSK
jgi:hypothetical protein